MGRKRNQIVREFPDPEFPLDIIRIPHHGEGQLHGHAFHELVIILGGSGRHATTNEAYRIERGDVFLISGDTQHCYAEPNRLSLVNILFFPKVLRLPLADLRRLPGYHVLFLVEPKLRRQHGFRGRLRLNTKQLAETSQLITRIEEEIAKRKPGYRTMASVHLMHLICYLSRCYSSGEDSPDERPWLRLGEVLSHIENNYAKSISVEQLAEIACMSESSLMRSFHKVTGKSPIDYVISVRVSRAGELLLRTDMNITEVAYACGFTDSNYFSRQFRRLRDCSPREYRQRRTQMLDGK